VRFAETNLAFLSSGDSKMQPTNNNVINISKNIFINLSKQMNYLYFFKTLNQKTNILFNKGLSKKTRSFFHNCCCKITFFNLNYIIILITGTKDIGITNFEQICINTFINQCCLFYDMGQVVSCMDIGADSLGSNLAGFEFSGVYRCASNQ